MNYLGLNSIALEMMMALYLWLCLAAPLYFWTTPFFSYLFKSSLKLGICSSFLFLEFFPEFPEWPVRPVWADLAPLFFSCPPSVDFFNESSGTFFAGASWWDFESSDLSSPTIIFSLLPIWLDLAELTLWDYSIPAYVYVQRKDSDPPSFVE